jgi:hypothetical protein
MRISLSKSLAVFITSIALSAAGAPPAGPVVPPPGGTLAPGPIGGQMAPGPVGGAITPGNILSAPPISGPPATGIPGGSLYIGTNGYPGNSTVIVPPGGTIRNGVVSGYNPAVIVARSNGIPGGTLNRNGVGGANNGVIVAGGTTTPSGTGGTIAPGTGGTLSNGTGGSVIVSGGQP